MRRIGQHGKHGVAKGPGKIRDLKYQSPSGSDIFRRVERIRIAPKHPGMGRR